MSPLRSPHGTIRIARISGVDVLARPSLLLMGIALVLLFAPHFEAVTTANPYVLAMTFVLALYLSILVHELAHVSVAQAYGMRVRGVTLHLLGGETSIDGESRTPGQELATAISGPIASALIGYGTLSLTKIASDGVWHSVFWAVGYVNLLIAVFNMLPGLPLDGGRVFRAVVWKVTGNEALGIRCAAWVGRLAALGIFVWGAARLFSNDMAVVTDAMIAAIIGWFLWDGSTRALRNAERISRINAISARRLATPPEVLAVTAPRLSIDLAGTELLRAMVRDPAEVYALVDADGTVVGTLHAAHVDAAYRGEQ